MAPTARSGESDPSTWPRTFERSSIRRLGLRRRAAAGGRRAGFRRVGLAPALCQRRRPRHGGRRGVRSPSLAAADSVIPNAGTVVGAGDRSFVSDLFLSNPDAGRDGRSVAGFLPFLVTGPPLLATVSLAPGESRAIAGLPAGALRADRGQGALLVTSTVPVATAVRIAARSAPGTTEGSRRLSTARRALAEARRSPSALPQTGRAALAISCSTTAGRRAPSR